jgi:hypothetical protein
VPKRAAAIAALALVAAAALTHGARAAPCRANVLRTADINGLLEDEARRARWWDLGWGAGFGAAALAEGTMAATRWELGLTLDDKQVAGLWVGAGQAAIASLSHVVLPLRVERADATGDPCGDARAAEHALDDAADHEAAAFWLGIAGAVALNGGALLVLGLHDDAWGQGALVAGIGLPVGVVHVWTTPRRAWRARDDGTYETAPVSWRIDSVRAIHTPEVTGLAISGSF